MSRWPQDTQSARNAFYGDPGKGEIGRQMVPVVPPFAMYYEGKRVKAIQFHKKAAPALLAALNEIWDAYGRDQKKVDAAGVSKYNGAYNHRMVRGSKTKWSNHAYASAIDLNAAENGLYAKGNMPQIVIDAFCRQGAMWGGWYKGRKDPMHFEFVDNGGRKPKSPTPVFGAKPLGLMSPPDVPADDIEQDEPSEAPDVAQPSVPAVLLDNDVQGDPEIFSVEKRLKVMNYYSGVLNGIWGGKTSEAICGFINDRELTITAPTSLEMFNEIRDALKDEMSRAESESPPFRRPVSDARAEAKPSIVAEVAPEIVPAKRGYIAQKWLAITTFVYGLWNAASDKISAAWDFFTEHKDSLPTPDSGWFATAAEWLGKVPIAVWILLGAAVFGALALNARSGVKKIETAVSTGAR